MMVSGLSFKRSALFLGVLGTAALFSSAAPAAEFSTDLAAFKSSAGSVKVPSFQISAPVIPPVLKSTGSLEMVIMDGYFVPDLSGPANPKGNDFWCNGYSRREQAAEAMRRWADYLKASGIRVSGDTEQVDETEFGFNINCVPGLAVAELPGLNSVLQAGMAAIARAGELNSQGNRAILIVLGRKYNADTDTALYEPRIYFVPGRTKAYGGRAGELWLASLRESLGDILHEYGYTGSLPLPEASVSEMPKEAVAQLEKDLWPPYPSRAYKFIVPADGAPVYVIYNMHTAYLSAEIFSAKGEKVASGSGYDGGFVWDGH